MQSCEIEDQLKLEDEKHQREITVADVKEKYGELMQSNTQHKSKDSLGIHWDGAAYKEMEFGDALFFPVDTDMPYYVSAGEDLVSFPVDGTSFVYAYKDSSGVQIEYYQPVATSHDKEFTGVILGSKWGETVSKILFYEKGMYKGTQRADISKSSGTANRIECFWVYYWVKDGYVNGHGPTPGWWESYLVCVGGNEPINLDGSSPSSVILEGGGAGVAPGESENDGLCPNPFVPGTYVKCSDLICPNGIPIDSWDEPCEEEKPLDEINNCDELTASQKNQLEAIVNDYLTKCTNLQIFEYVVGEEKKFCFKVDRSLNSPGGFNYTNSNIIFKSPSNINQTTFAEEFFHGYQHIFYGGLGQYTNVGRSNIEFEAKLYYDLTNGGDCCITFGDTDTFMQYYSWLFDITNGFTKLPTWQQMSENYFFFLEKFKNEKPEYNYPIDYNLMPNALLNLNNC